MRKSEAAFSVAFIAALASSLWLWHALAAERLENAELVARLQTPAATNTSRVPMNDVVRTTVANASSPTQTTAPTETTSQPRPGTGAEQDWTKTQRRLLEDPKYREASREQRRLVYAPRREKLIRLLGFTPAQADAVIDLQIDTEFSWMQNGGTYDGRIAAAEADLQIKLKSLLGEARFGQLEDYMASRGTRMQVDRFRGELTGTDLLRDDQIEPLIAALQVESARQKQELGEYEASLAQGDPTAVSKLYEQKQVESLKSTNIRMHAAAVGILSSSQLKGLDAMLERDVKRLENEQHIRRLRRTIDGDDGDSGKN
jgi:hypothetical protein